MYEDLNKKYIQDDNGNYRLFDPEGNDLKKKTIKDWYDITQRLANLLFELDSNDYRLDKEQRRKFHKALDDFGWSEQKKSGVFHQDNLDPNSPYMILSYLYGVENTVNKKQLKELDEAKKVNTLVSSVPEEKESEYSDLSGVAFYLLTEVFSRLSDLDDPKRIFIDENSDVKLLYSRNQHDEEQALNDINDIHVLSERFYDLLQKLNNISALSRHPGSLNHWIEHEIIYEAIALGYTAGINANTTQTLRKMKKGNKSNNNSSKR